MRTEWIFTKTVRKTSLADFMMDCTIEVQRNTKILLNAYSSTSSALNYLKGIGRSTIEATEKEYEIHSFAELGANIGNFLEIKSEAKYSDMKEDRSDDKGNNCFRTPSDNTDRKKYHNHEKRVLQKHRHATARSVSENTDVSSSSSPRSRGLITLRRINLSKLFTSPIDYEPALSHISKIKMTDLTCLETPDFYNRKEQINCENVANLTSILMDKSILKIEQPGKDRLPTFLPYIENAESLYTDEELRMNKLCKHVYTHAQRSTNTIDKVYDNCNNSSMNSRQAGNMKTSNDVSRIKMNNTNKSVSFTSRNLPFINHLKAAAPKQLSDHTSIPSNLPQTSDTNCENFIEASNLSNVDISDNNHECNNYIHQLSGNALEFKLPTVTAQPWLIQNHSTPLPNQKANPKKSYSCGRVSLSSFDDYSFSPVQVTLPPESPQEIPVFVTSKAINICNKVTASEPEIQNVNVLSVDNLCDEADGKLYLESLQIEKREKPSVEIIDLNHNQESCISERNEIKVKDTKASVTKSRNAKDNSLKASGTSETPEQRMTRTAMQRLKQISLEHKPSKVNADGVCQMVKSEKRSRPIISVKNRGKIAVRHRKSEHTKNYSESSPVTSSELDAVINAHRSKRVMKAHSARVKNLCKEKTKSLEAEDSEILTNATSENSRVLRRKECEHFKKQEVQDPIKNNSIANDRAEIAKESRKIRKGQKVILTLNSDTVSALVNNNEMTVTKMSQSGKKLSVKVDKVLNNSFEPRSSALNKSETNKVSDVTNAARKLPVRTSSRGIDSQKHFPPKTVLDMEKEERKKTHNTRFQSHQKSEQCHSLGVEKLKGKIRSSVPRYIPAKSQQPHSDSSSVLVIEGNQNELINPELLKHQNCSDQTISYDERNLAELESHIHHQSSISEVIHKYRSKPSRKKVAIAHNQEVTLNSRKSKKKNSPKECDGNRNIVSHNSFKKSSLQEVHNFRNINMPQRQLRKRKTEPVISEDLPDEESKVITKAKVKEEKKGQAKVDAKKSLKHKKPSTKKESHLELTLDNGVVKKTKKGIIKKQGEATAVSARKKKVQAHDYNTSKSKTKEEPKYEDTSSTITQAGQKFVGAHCSIAGGLSNAVKEAVSIGARAFGLFVRNGRTWKLNPLDVAEAEKFKKACKEYGFLPHLILPHGSYLLNCGSSNPETLQKSRNTLIHELQICEMLGLELYNFHPGSACGKGSIDECLKTVAESINLAHQKTHSVKTVIENMSCQGSTVGGKFEELKVIIDNVIDKSRIGVCLDTCHAFAAGFDLSSEDGFNKCIEAFDTTVGLQYLCAMHLNDSKGNLGCHLDRHENIGKGHIGLEGFRSVMNDPRMNNIPLILETPVNDYAKEIRILYGLQNL